MPKKKTNVMLVCGFCGKPADHRGSGHVYPIPGSDDPTEGRQACAKCRQEQTDKLIELGLFIPLDTTKGNRLDDKPIKRKPVRAKDSPLHERLLKLIREKPLTDKVALKLVKPKSDLRKVQQGFYRLRRDGTAVKLADSSWQVTAKGLKE